MVELSVAAAALSFVQGDSDLSLFEDCWFNGSTVSSSQSGLGLVLELDWSPG